MAARVPEDLLIELRGLPPRVREEILASLLPSERERAETLLGDETVPEGKDRPVPGDLTAPSVTYSPWLAARLRDARDNGKADPNMTAATRRVLVQSAEALAADTCIASQSDPEPVRSRSLLGVIGGLLSPRRFSGTQAR